MKKSSISITAGAIHARAHQEMPRPFLLGGAVATTRSLTAVAIDYLLVKISEVQVPQRTQNTGGTTPVIWKAPHISYQLYHYGPAFHAFLMNVPGNVFACKGQIWEDWALKRRSSHI